MDCGDLTGKYWLIASVCFFKQLQNLASNRLGAVDLCIVTGILSRKENSQEAH